MHEYKIRDGAVLEFREGVEYREVSPEHQGYVAWLDVGNSPEVLPSTPQPVLTLIAARAAINARRDALEFGIFTDTHGHRYDVDERSRARLTGAVVMSAAIPSEGIVWTDADNLPRTHTQASLLSLAGEILLWTDALHQHASYLKGKLERGEEYDITTGWPA
ncbi:MAG: hypothetical protein FD177_986 [Desulfovibrionaceae bacterium]|nr:MAG: hypothetical protein FD177_986 [Desulfovibrionaceae bacterium]